MPKKGKKKINYFTYLARACANVWRLKSESRNECLASGLKIVEKKMVKDNGKIVTKKMKTYKCSKCGIYYQKLDVDHVIPRGKSPETMEEFFDFIKRQESTNLQLLCTFCHGVKTDSDNEAIKGSKNETTRARNKRVKQE